MKALVYTNQEELSYQEMPIPVPKENEVLIKIDSVGICGSDMHAFLGHDERRPAPLILGHEVSGTRQSGAKKGQKISINPLVTCGNCKACNNGQENLCSQRQIISMPPREGAFAEWICMPEVNLIDLPDHLSLEAAALIEPIACGWHAIKLALNAIHSSDQPSLKVLVIGGGAVGFGSVLSLEAMGIHDIVIAEPSELRRQYLSAKSKHKFIDSKAIQPNSNFDIIIDAAGFEATRMMASKEIRPGGVIVHIGLGSSSGGLDIRRMTLQEIQFIGCYTYTAQDFKDTAQAVIDGKISELSWMEIRELSAGQEAFKDIRSGNVKAPKIILKPNLN